MRIAFLVPTTTKSRNFVDMNQTYLYKYLLNSVKNTCSLFDYKIFIGVDQDDDFYNNHISELSECDITLLDSSYKGHLTRIWNVLFEKAYNIGYDYFVQCGDDISFKEHWLETCIASLSKNNDIGIAGPIDVNNHKLITQTVVSRKHMEIFGYYFPDEIRNWYCDDWINRVYGELDMLFINGICENNGGIERYTISNVEQSTINTYVEIGKDKINMYVIKSYPYKKYAIIFTAYNRTSYLTETLTSWMSVENIDMFDVYFKVEPSDKLEEILIIIEAFRRAVNTSTFIIVNKTRLGCSKNTFDAFEYVFKKYDFCVLAEDDFIVSNDVCNYFAVSESHYREDLRVAVITASCPYFINSHVDVIHKSDIFIARIWGTWKTIWETYFKDTWEFDYKSGGWDWNLSLNVFPANNLQQIQPCVSRSNHIGVTGIHCNENLFKETISPSFNKLNNCVTFKEIILK